MVVIVRVVSAACALGILVISAVPAQAKSRVRTLKITILNSQEEHGYNDAPPAGRSKGDVFLSSAPVHRKGRVVGRYDLSATFTDEDQGDGRARAIYLGSTTIRGRGQLITSGIAVVSPRPAPGTTQGLGGKRVSKRARFAIIGGTGDFAGARGELFVKRGKARDRWRYRYRL